MRGKEGKRRKGKRKEGKGREGKRREEKGREGKRYKSGLSVCFTEEVT